MGEVIPAKKMREKIERAQSVSKPPPSDRARPSIVYTPGELPRVINDAESALITATGKPRIYQRGGSLVRIVRHAPHSARRVKRAPGAITILPFDVPSLVELLTDVADWLRVDKRSDGYKAINCPHEVPLVLLARGQWKVPPLTAVIEAPTLRPSGSVLAEAGYDKETGLFLDLGTTTFQPIDEAPDREKALAALNQLLDVLSEFPFASDADKSVAIAAILTGLVRQSLTGAPLFGFSATVMGSGKTYLAQVVSLLACGRMAAVIAPPKDSKEEDKTIFSSLLEGDHILVYDNVEHQLSSDLLCAILTSETLRGRVLGTSKTAAVSTACTFMVTGNNLTVAGDLSARALVCRLDPKSDHPEHRKFSRDLTLWIPEQRGRLVAAALTFLRGYLSSGKKPSMEPWQRFPDWDNLIRASIVWAGLSDPLLALRQGEAGDPRRLEHQAVMEAWMDVFGDRATPVREAIKSAQGRALMEDHRLIDALIDVAGERGEVNLRRLGRWLSKVAGRIQGGLKIERGSVSGGAQTWRVVTS